MIAARESSEYLRVERERRERVAAWTQYAIAAAMGVVLLLLVMVTR